MGAQLRGGGVEVHEECTPRARRQLIDPPREGEWVGATYACLDARPCWAVVLVEGVRRLWQIESGQAVCATQC